MRFLLTVVALGLLPGFLAAQTRIRQPISVPTRAGPSPTGAAVTGTPGAATVAWQPVAGAADVVVERWLEADPACCRVASGPLGPAAVSWTDGFTPAQPYGRYLYRVTASYPDLTFGSADIPFDRPAPAVPTGFVARHLGAGTVSLQWQSVSGVVSYRVVGSGVPNGRLTRGAGATVSNVLPGPGTWQVMAVYPGGYVDPNAAASTGLVVRFLPTHAPAWLSKPNGPGNPQSSAMHHSQICASDCLSGLPSGTDIMTREFINIWGDPLARMSGREAVYANTTDLGFGRRTNCGQMMNPPTARFPGFVTLCYSTSHGPGPGESGFNDPRVTTRAAVGGTPAPKGKLSDPWGVMPRGGSVIVIDAKGAIFLSLTMGVFNLDDADVRSISWVPWQDRPVPLQSVALDSEGPKFAPQACLACHGGVYDVATNRVRGASLLPLDPGQLTLPVYQAGDPVTIERRFLENNIRRINQVVMTSGASPAVVDYIRGLYNGATAQPYASFQPDYVPSGWTPQAGLYRQVVKPYCASCHLAAQPGLSFSSWSNFLANKARIHRAVCVDRSMPHSEIAFREFWTRDTGPLFLPGLLAATLGYPSCP